MCVARKPERNFSAPESGLEENHLSGEQITARVVLDFPTPVLAAYKAGNFTSCST